MMAKVNHGAPVSTISFTVSLKSLKSGARIVADVPLRVDALYLRSYQVRCGAQ